MGFIFYLGTDYKMRLREESATTFNLMPFLIFAVIFPVFIGFFLRLPKLIIEIKEKKQWSFDWIKVAEIGIPSLYIAMIPILTFYFGLNLLFGKEFLLLRDTTFTTTAGIVFGYVLLDSLKE
ncbi:hypothetical protein [Psychrobacillus sp. L3]|uniref:hypothetical protein n=1 Tax=Psychrobacillus sp. L3 TaxID=3236891 RepID=UPI0036F28D8A